MYCFTDAITKCPINDSCQLQRVLKAPLYDFIVFDIARQNKTGYENQ